MRTTTECQRRLIDRGYLPAVDPQTLTPSDDGKFGEKSVAAYNHYRAAQGWPPINPPVHLDQLNADLFPEERPAPPAPPSNPINDFITGLVIKTVLSKLKGSTTMNFLTGYKTFIIGGILIVCGAVEFFGIQIPGMSGDPATLIMTGIGMITGRLGAKTEAAKVAGP